MNDEVEIIRVALQGSEILLRVSAETAKEGLKFAKWLVMIIPNAIQWGNNFGERRRKSQLTKEEMNEIKRLNTKLQAGAVPLDQFMERYHAQERTILNIPDRFMEEFANQAILKDPLELEEEKKKGKKKEKKKDQLGLSYAVMPDLNLSDGMFQVMVPNDQLDLAQSILAHLASSHEEEIKQGIETAEQNCKEAAKKVKEAEALKARAEREGMPKEKPEEYRQLCQTYKEAQKELAQRELALAQANNQVPSTMSIEEYMNTNKAIFDHVDVANELTLQDMKPAGSSKVQDFLTTEKEVDEELCLVSPEAPLSVHRQKEENGMYYVLKEQQNEVMRLKITEQTAESDIAAFTKAVEKKEKQHGVQETGKEWFLLPIGDEEKAEEIIKKKQEELKSRMPVENPLESMEKTLAAGELAKDESYVVIDKGTVVKNCDDKGVHIGYRIFGEKDDYMEVPGVDAIGTTPEGYTVLYLREKEYNIKHLRDKTAKDTISGKDQIGKYVAYASKQKAKQFEEIGKKIKNAVPTAPKGRI